MHDADELCDRVAFIADGEIKAMDTPENLKLSKSKKSILVKTVSNHQHEFVLAGLGNNQEFLSLIKSEEIATIHSQEASLDEIFIQVTGKKLV